MKLKDRDYIFLQKYDSLLKSQNSDLVIDAFCPICQLEPSVIRYLHDQIDLGNSPKMILSNLKQRGIIPKDDLGEIITSESWEKAIYFHLKQCLRVDPKIYKAKLDKSTCKDEPTLLKGELSTLIKTQIKIIKIEQEKILSGTSSPDFIELIQSLKLLLSAI